MFQIGDFATFTQVSIRTLHHWERIGLLHPAWVDPDTGYRRYRADQAAVVHRILALRALGFTLAQIRPLLDRPPGAEALAGMLRLRRAEADEARRRSEERIAMIEAKLRLLEGSARMAHAHDIVRKTAPAVRLAARSARIVPAEDDPARLAEVFGRLFGELTTGLATAGLRPVGPPWSLYERADEDGLVVHAALPVGSSDPADGLVVIDRPATEVVSTLHAGRLDDMAATYAAVMEWIEAAGLSAAGGAAEISLVWDPGNPDGNLTELQVPVSARS